MWCRMTERQRTPAATCAPVCLSVRLPVSRGAVAAELRAPLWFSVMFVEEKRERARARGRSYAEYCRRGVSECPEQTRVQIEQDLPRTMPEHEEFNCDAEGGREGWGALVPPLERVLLALSGVTAAAAAAAGCGPLWSSAHRAPG
jgi:hypothetical protein